MVENIETVRDGREGPKTRCERCREGLKKLRGGITVTLVLSVAIHIAMIVIGSMNMKNCPAAVNVPIYLIAEGVIGILTKLIFLTRDFILRYFRVDEFLSVIVLVEIVFFICGSVWVFQVLEPKYDPADGDLYCDRTTYLLALIFISCIYFTMVVVLFCVLCGVIGYCVLCDCIVPKICGKCNVNDDVEGTRQEDVPLPALRAKNKG